MHHLQSLPEKAVVVSSFEHICSADSTIPLLLKPYDLDHVTTRYDIRYDTIRYDTVRYGPVRSGTLRYATLRYDTIRYDTIRYYFVFL